MRKMFSKVLLAISAIAMLLTSCSKMPEQSKYIPKTASLVLSVNSKQISKKLITNGITMDKLFAAVQEKDSASEAQKFWKDIENSGLDLQANSFVSVVYSKNQSYVTLTGGLKDAAKFEEYLKKNVSNFSLQTKSDFKYILEDKQEAVIAWNKGTVIYLKGIEGDAMKKALPPTGLPTPDTDSDEESSDSNNAQPASLVTAAADDMQTWVTEVDHLFHLKKDETAGSIEAFNDLLKNNADLSVYINPEPIYNAQAAMMPANLKTLLAGCYYTGAVNFEKGKVLVDGISYVGKDLAGIYKKYGNMEADLDMLEKYPSQNITGFVVYGFDFRMIGDIVKSTGLDGLANMGLQSSGLTLDDILNAFKGQLVFVASDFQVKKKPSLYIEGDSTTTPESKWVFAMKVGDKAAFDKVMSSPMLKGFFTKQGDTYVLTQNMPGMPAISITDKLVTSASDSALLQEYLAGKGKAGGLDNSFVSKIKGNPMGAYVNFEKIVNNIPDEEIPADGKPLAGKFKNLLKDMTALSSSFDGKTQHSEIVLNFKNETENSLVQLVNLGTETAKYLEEKKKADAAKETAAVAADSAAAAVEAAPAEEGKH
ncbi:DUF4836 family protein [Chitinophaga filiformis]|uniref:DUF4836 family protein n=1 Tax=Chitinophaga filiformis TaxID=104663 RepID=A0ABY4I2Z6_CHIFI|nr:DUF4836 family protein [Chitinophaga filiformis]UPK70477.1 DUF4836 family protein [Chitinophaga filiformis]